MTFYVSVISALVIVALAIFVNQFADRFDEEINSCGLGTYKEGACQCIHPYVGTHCETVDCGYGRLINSLFESSLITTPNTDSDIGCACESKFWGYSCANCTSRYPSDCSGPCLDNYYGARCDIICKESTASDAVGYAHEQAGGTFNFYTESHGICLYDGSVRCNPGRAGSHCEFQCLDCEYGSCNLNDGSCDCFAGYYGDLCNMTCPGRCSGNNGICQEDGTCACDAGFTGDDCSLECCIRDGGTSIGRVHGSCDPTGGCLCDDGWTGPSCDCNDLFTCSDRGTCSNVSGTCVCEEQFEGARCEFCNDLKIGPFCQYDRYQCPSREQQNGEFVAVNTRGDYRCKCKAGFQGADCTECSAVAYPKNGTEMCSFVIPASLCNRGTVKDTYQGTGIMCDCETNFNPSTDCASCNDKYYGSNCEIFCDFHCTDSGGQCEATGCVCPKGKTSVDGVCELCGGDTDCLNGDCELGRCQCDPGFYGDDCSISAAQTSDGKVCNGYQSNLNFEDAECQTDEECLDLESDNIRNQAVAYRAQQYDRVSQTFCHRLDIPVELKGTVGCCVDSNADGKCDAANLLDDSTTCTGDMVPDICNQRTLEGEVNIFDWCTSQSLGCLMNGECTDVDLCEDRCDDGLNSSEWIEKWEEDHIQSMESVMNESWKFPIHFPDPYNVRQYYYSASLDDVCPAPSGYNSCRDALIPPDATVYNATHKFVDGWQAMPSFHSCELQHHVLKAVNGTYIYNFSSPIWADRIEMVSDATRTAAYGRLGQNDASYYGNVSGYIDSIMLFGRGDVEVIIYNYTTDSCVDLMKRSASNFAQCQQYAFYEFEYDWDDFCEWKDTVLGPGGFEQRCYDQSLVCAGCEFWQQGCENLPLLSEYPFPMPDPCTPWSNTFCDEFLNVTFRQTGTCAYTECECEGYGVGGPACDLQCAVPRFVNSESSCGSDLSPPWGTCERDRGVLAFGFEQGRCNCFNGGDPNLGCAIVCTNNDECSQDIDTPFTFDALNCSEFQDLVSFEVLSTPSVSVKERCLVNLRDSTCNYWRGRCECATPYTTFTLLNQTIYSNMGSYRVALMQGYDIDEYQPFTSYYAPTEPIIEVVNRDTLCWDPFKYPVDDSFVCDSDFAYRNTDSTFDDDKMSCQDYTLDDCGKTRNSTIVAVSGICDENGILDKEGCLLYARQYDRSTLNVKTRTNRHRSIDVELGKCKAAKETCNSPQKPMYSFQVVWDETDERYADGEKYAGCDSAKIGGSFNEGVCNGASNNNFFSECCKTADVTVSSGRCISADTRTDVSPYKIIRSGLCENEEGYEPIETEEECQAAIDMINLGSISNYHDTYWADYLNTRLIPELSDCSHDIIDLSSYTSVGSGYCGNQIFLLPSGGIFSAAPLLSSGDTFYNADRNRECMNRCINLCRKEITHFFVRNSDNTCVCATGCDNLLLPSQYEAYKINLGSNPSGDPTRAKGCTLDVQGINTSPVLGHTVKFNPYTGVNFVPANHWVRYEDLICKRKGTLGSQLVARNLTCESGCAAVSYAEAFFSSEYASSSGGDGSIMQDCLMFTERTLYDQNEITIGSGNNFLVWDLEGLKTSFGVEITTNMRQIRPNTLLSPIYTNDAVVVSVYSLDKDVTLTAAVTDDWTFIEDFNFELKPDKPPTLTVSQGQCAGDYFAGSVRTTISTQYEVIKQWEYGIAVGQSRECDGVGASNTATGTEAPDGSIVWDTTSLGGSDASPNPKQACADWCDSQGYAGFNTHGPWIGLDVLCECASCATQSVVAGWSIGHLITSPAVVAEKTPLELQGDWYSNGRRIHKSQVVEYKFSKCRDFKNATGPRCTRAMSKSNCIASMNENEACVQYKDGLCTSFCKSSTDCCDGSIDVDEDAGFSGNYVPIESLALTDVSTFYYKPEYSCCGEEKHYFYFAQGFCSRDNIALQEKPLHLPGPDQHPYLPESRSFRQFNSEAFELTPLHPLYREDKKEECALRCKEVGATEFFIIYKYTNTLMPEERCHCNDRVRCDYLVQNGALTQYQPSIDTYSDPDYPEYGNYLPLRMESYIIVDTCSAVDAADVSFGCDSPYKKVTSPNAPFNDVVHRITATGDASYVQPDHARNAGWVHETVKLDNADDYFKLWNEGVPHLMNEKCAYTQEFFYDSLDSRFLKFMVSAEEFMHHAIVIDPIATEVEVILSDEKSGCVDDGHEIVHYDFMKTNVTKKRYECKYSVISTDEICDNSVQFGTASMGIMECADACGSAFAVDNSQMCFCAWDSCSVRTASVGSTTYNWQPNDCGFQYLADGTCTNAMPNNPGDLHSCRDYCLSQGVNAFSFKENPYECYCCLDTVSITGTGTTYTFTPEQTVGENFVKITDKSCEHYGHRSIMDEDTCKRAAIEFGGSPSNIFDVKLVGRCVGEARNYGEITTSGSSVVFNEATSVAECSIRCGGKFTIRYDTPLMCACVQDCSRVEYSERLARWASVTAVDTINLYEHSAWFNSFPAAPTDLDNSGDTYPTYPHLVDIDNDGDLDLFVVRWQAPVLYFKNTWTSGDDEPVFIQKYGADNPLDGIGCGKDDNGGHPSGCTNPSSAASFSTCFQELCQAAFGDVDGDGDVDVVFGRDKRDNINLSDLRNYYRNDGTPEIPNFVHVMPNANPFEGIEFVRANTWPAMPIFWDWDQDGDVDLLVGKANAGNTEVLYYENSAGTFIERTGVDNPFDSIGSSPPIYRLADINGDGVPEIWRVPYIANAVASPHLALDSDGTWAALAPDFSPLNGILAGTYAFGDLFETGSLDVIIANRGSSYGLNVLRNWGNENFANFRFPEWAVPECAFLCKSNLGFSVEMDFETTVTCKCADDLTLTPSSDPIAVYKPFTQNHESWQSVNYVTRGCSLDGFSADNIEMECQNCICAEGDGVYTPEFVEVTSGTCSSNGYTNIGMRSKCFNAVDQLGYDMGTLPSNYFSDLSLVEAAPLGCSYNARPYFGDGSVACSLAQKCLCQRTSSYKEVATISCALSNLYAIKTPHECLAASVEFDKGTNIQFSTTGTTSFKGCITNAGTTTFVSAIPAFVSHVFTENDKGALTGTLLCRKQPYNNDDYVPLFDDTNQNGEACSQVFITTPNGGTYFPEDLSPVRSQEECERAAVSLGLSIGGMNAVTLGGYPDMTTFRGDFYNGCNYWMNGYAAYRDPDSNPGVDYCTHFRPCLCKRELFPKTNEVFDQFQLLPLERYIDIIESKYVLIDDGASCDTGFDTVSGIECDTAKQLFGVTVDAPDCVRICKHEATQCEGDEVCICRTDTPVEVFNSNESCVICGGGEEFNVESFFFNENGNTRSCIPTADQTCLTSSTGWTQYRMNPNFGGNQSVFAPASFTGYCSTFVDIPGDYNSMILDDVIDHCQRLCRSWDYFAVKRDSCKCTHACTEPFESDFWQTFQYQNKPVALTLDRAEFLRIWENRDPNIQCFKDLDHSEWVDCEWIRALKHFARGASYRVGDCHHIGPGVGEGVASQIPCSGHGFLSAGTCACDYAENLDLKDTGIGLTFELPTLRQTPFRGRGCEMMCPGYDLKNMESVCSGHGRCESDGRCACDQGFVGFKCHLACETDTEDLTCSGHGVCNIVHQPVREDILESIKTLNCNRSSPELLFLQRDRVIRTDSSIYHMYLESFDLLVDIYHLSVRTRVSFDAGTGMDYIVRIDEDEIQNDPEITVCRLANLVKTFDGHPLNIIDDNGNFVVYNWTGQDQITLTAAAGTYTYYATANPEMRGQLILEDCPDKVTRNYTMEDFYIKGEALRQPYNTVSDYPYMACEDTISVKREEALHPLLAETTPDVYINCALKSGMLGAAYTVVCAECACSYTRAAGHWTGYNCRTPAIGYLAEDGKTSCPAMVDKVPCNGRGSCSWGSVDGLGLQIASSSNCFCGDPTSSNYSIIPRDDSGQLMLHAESFGTPLYMDRVAVFEGDTDSCPEGLISVTENECSDTKDGNLVSFSATIIVNQEYELTPITCAGFDAYTSTDNINRVSASGELVIEGSDQETKCAAACFSHYKFKTNGKKGGALMFNSLSGSFEDNVKTCGFTCMNRNENPNGIDWDGFSLFGFSVNEKGQCYCESDGGVVILDADWRYYEYSIPYTEVPQGGLCLLNKDLVFSDEDNSVPSNPGQTPAERLDICARKCQLYRSSVDAVGFSYKETNSKCYCEMTGSDCVQQSGQFRRFDFTLYNIFDFEQDTECKCGRSGTSGCFPSLMLPDVFPDFFTLTEPTLEYENFVCRRNGNYVCKPGEFVLNNFLHNCACRDGFTGPLCETPRMMCLFGGTEIDGTQCDCLKDGVQDSNLNPRGCCPYGMFWQQERYSSFTPLEEFRPLPNNVFYKDALLTVCKPAPSDSMQSPGTDTEEDRALRQQRYVATTKDHELITSVPCVGETEVSLFKAVFTGTNSPNSYIGDAYFYADDVTGYFSSHNAKMRCLDFCTIEVDLTHSGGYRPKQFNIRPVFKGGAHSSFQLDENLIRGEPNDLQFVMGCFCDTSHGYINYKEEQLPGKHQPHYKIRDVIKPRPNADLRSDPAGQLCLHETEDISQVSGKGKFVSALKYAKGLPGYSNCKDNQRGPNEGGVPPDDAETIYHASQTYALRLKPGDEGYYADALQECGVRCGRSGFDAFWTMEVLGQETCTCIDSVFSVTETTADGVNLTPAWIADTTAHFCNVYQEDDRFSTCLQTCWMGGYNTLQWHNIAVYQACYCWNFDSCVLTNSNDHEVYTIRLPQIFEETYVQKEMSMLFAGSQGARVGDFYDIVFPQGQDDLECFQTENGDILKHVDPRGFDGLADNDGFVNEVGVPYTMIKQDLAVKSVVKEVQLATMNLCYAYCTQEKKKNSRINSLAFVPTFETKKIVYAGSSAGIKLPRCWGPCSTDVDCETGLTCQTRDIGQGPGMVQGIFGCQEPQTTSSQFDPGGTLGMSAVCAVSKTEYLETLDCKCIEHDEDHECNQRKIRGGNSPTKGECLDGVIQGLPFGPDDPFYNSNKIQECQERCIRLNPDVKAFYISQVDYSCGCSTGYCKLGSDQNYQVYDVAPPFGPSCEKIEGYYLGFDTGLYTEPFVQTNMLDLRPPNPITCNIESYLHIGDIMDSGQCECPIYDHEIVYGDTQNYLDMGNAMFKQSWVFKYMDYPQMQRLDIISAFDKVAGCKQACDDYPDCTEIAVDATQPNQCWGVITSPFFYNNIPVSDFQFRKISDRECNIEQYTSLGTNPLQFATIDDCVDAWATDSSLLMEEYSPVISFGATSPTTTNCKVTSASNHYSSLQQNDDHFKPGKSDWLCTHDLTPTSVRTIDAGYGETSGVVEGVKVPTYLITMEPTFYMDPFYNRYKKQLLNEEVNRYCPTGEIVEYNETESHEDANPHYCMQRCKQKLMLTDSEFILSRGDIVDGKFFCYCSLTFDNTCNLNGPSAFAQFKVYKKSGAYTSSERLMSAQDPQVAKTTQCKCQGYYISHGKARSCPENTFKNSGHCTSSCEKCPIGRFSEIGSMLCSQCPAGQIRISGACQKCAVGQFATASDTECQTCPMGRLTTKIGTSVCDGCPSGWFDNDAFEGVNCNMCAVGQHTDGLTSLSACIDCPRGFYSEETGKTNCDACGSGRFTTTVGGNTHTVCTGCVAGKHNDKTGQDSCKDCGRGQYTSQTARSSCSLCPLGRYQGIMGMTACTNCAAGYFTNALGRPWCSACNAGQYQPYSGKTYCTFCLAGRFSNQGSSSCPMCPHGYWTNLNTQATCKNCPSANPGGVFEYSSNSWNYAGSADKITKDESCDSYFIWAESNKNTYYTSKNSGGDWNFDCVNFMSLNRGGGMRTRRQCWTGKSNNCNTFACNVWGDCSNIWFSAPATGQWHWCYPGGTLASYGWYGWTQINDV